MIDLLAMQRDAVRPYDPANANCFTATLAACRHAPRAGPLVLWWYGLDNARRAALEARGVTPWQFRLLALRFGLWPRRAARVPGIALIRTTGERYALGICDGSNFWVRGSRGIVRVHPSRVRLICRLS